MKRITETLISRIDDLVKRAAEIQRKAVTKSITKRSEYWGTDQSQSWQEYPAEESQIWRQHFTTLIHMVLKDGAPNYDRAIKIAGYNDSDMAVDEGRVFLMALREDLENGFLTPAFHRIDAEITVDYLEMATSLLADGKSAHDHVPAAVLAGAILERGLRSLCERQSPPLPTVDQHGDKKTLNPLIDDLKRVGVYNELKAKHLRVWAGIRNAAAHGEFDKFNRGEVENMLSGITQFLADYLG